MTNLAVIHKEEDGVQFFTLEATGESGMSRSGLARLCGVQESSIRELLDNLGRGKATSKSLESLLGKKIQFEGNVAYKNAVIIRDEICAGIIEYYALDARKTTEEAKFALRKFLRKGIKVWIHGITGWGKTKVVVLKEPENLLVEKWIQEIVVSIVSDLFVEVANNISNIESITIQQKKLLRTEFQKGISREQLHAKAQKALGKIGHNASHQYSSIIEVAAEQAAPYLDLIVDRVQKALQDKSFSLALPPATEPKVIKEVEYIKVGVPKSLEHFVEKMKIIYDDIQSGNWKRYGKNWTEYSKRRWNVGHQHGYRLRNDAKLYGYFKDNAIAPMPVQEHQIRDLAEERDNPELWVKVWREAAEWDGEEPKPATVKRLIEEYKQG